MTFCELKTENYKIDNCRILCRVTRCVIGVRGDYTIVLF